MIKQFFRKIVGLDKLDQAKAQALAEVEVAKKLANQAIVAAAEAAELEQRAKETPKERATAKGEPWVAVLDTHVAKDNIRNGFFELDWNDQFVLQLKQAGYGFDGDPDEQIVDRWFRDLARQLSEEEGIDTNRGAGFIDVKRLAGGKAEVK